jgi:hypothetical protein
VIRVTVELVSAIDRSRDRVLGICEIANVGGTAQRGIYKARISKWAPKLGETWRNILVGDFDRLNRGPWDLLLRVLNTGLRGRMDPEAPTLDRLCDEPGATSTKGDPHDRGAVARPAVVDAAVEQRAAGRTVGGPAEPPSEMTLREALWLAHGHFAALYGDDGEMQCPIAPLCDFKRDSPQRIAEHIARALETCGR